MGSWFTLPGLARSWYLHHHEGIIVSHGLSSISRSPILFCSDLSKQAQCLFDLSLFPSSPVDLGPCEEDVRYGNERAGGCPELEVNNLEPGDLSGGASQAEGLENLGEQDASDGEHGPAAVLELGLNVPLELVGLLAKVEGVKAVVSGQAAVQVVRQGGAGEPAGAVGLGRL